METPNPTRGPDPAESADAERWVADLTGMTRDAAKTFLGFHTGMRWLRRDDRD